MECLEAGEEERDILTTVLNRNIVDTILYGQVCEYALMRLLLESFRMFWFKNKSPWLSKKVQNKIFVTVWGKNVQVVVSV